MTSSILICTFFAALTFLLTVSATTGFLKDPPNGEYVLPQMRNLDFEQYKGTWYLIEFGPPSGANLPCISETYTRNAANPNLADIRWLGGEYALDGVIAPGLNFEQPWVFYMDQSRFESTILSTDYTTWAIENTVGSAPNGTEFRRTMIRSRTRSLNPAVLQTLRSFIRGYGLTFEMVAVDQNNC